MNPPIDLSSCILHTPRLTLRPWTMDDLEDLYAYASVDGVGQMAGWLPHDSRETSRRILEDFISGGEVLALEYEGRVVGSLGVHTYDEVHLPAFLFQPCREIGFVLAKDCWGKGLMCEAVHAVVRYLFDEVGLYAVLCGSLPWNRQSARVQEKCGFRFHTRIDDFTTRSGAKESVVYTVLYRTQWLAAQE